MGLVRTRPGGLVVAMILALCLSGIEDGSALVRRRETAGPAADEASAYARAEKAAASGDCATALPLLEEAHAAAPEDADVLALRGYCLRRRGRLDDAFASYRRALEIRPEFPAARQYLGEAHLQATLREVEILRGYGESGRAELDALVSALREAADQLARRKGRSDAPQSRW